jgi:hypothetical protein
VKLSANHCLPSTESSNYELYCLRDFGAPSNSSLLQLLAIDIFSTFLRALVMKNRTKLERKFGNTIWAKPLETIGGYLIEHGVCAASDTKLAIVPALLELNIKQADVLEQTAGDELDKSARNST